MYPNCKKKLLDFQLDLDRIVAITTDDLAVMVKIGKLLGLDQQLFMVYI